jgi:hypothetical protein
MSSMDVVWMALIFISGLSGFAIGAAVSYVASRRA